MLGLSRRARSFVASVGAVFACAGFALVPLHGRPAAGSSRALETFADSRERPFQGSQEQRLRPIADPFARPLPDTRAKVDDAHRLVAIKPQTRGVIVRAIVAGADGKALIEFGDGSQRIVALGDPIDSSRVAAIEPGAIVLGDGRRFELSASR